MVIDLDLRLSVSLNYDIDAPTDLLMQIEAAEMPEQTVLETEMSIDGDLSCHVIGGEDDIGLRRWLECKDRLTCTYTATVRVDRDASDLASLDADPMHELPTQTIRYLMASRFCPSDEFQSFADATFGHLTGGARVVAISDWISNRFTYAPGASVSTTTAIDSFVSRKGICRDYAHVLIALARASAIPARMVSCYAPRVDPQDFHAVAQVWLNGGWHLVDPTGMSTASETAIIGVGRDAADIAFLTSYGWITMNNQTVTVKTV